MKGSNDDLMRESNEVKNIDDKHLLCLWGHFESSNYEQLDLASLAQKNDLVKLKN